MDDPGAIKKHADDLLALQQRATDPQISKEECKSIASELAAISHTLLTLHTQYKHSEDNSHLMVIRDALTIAHTASTNLLRSISTITQAEIDVLNDTTRLAKRMRTNNLTRVTSLLEHCASLYFKRGVTRQIVAIRSDIFRSAIVLAHAVTEDCIRELARSMLPTLKPDNLKDVCFPSTKPLDRIQKLTVAEITAYRGKSVDRLIQESFDQYLDHRSFNSTTEIISFLRAIGLDVVGILSPTDIAHIEKLISRRHRIVHNADCIGRRNARPITATELHEYLGYMNSLFALHTSVLTALERSCRQRHASLADNNRPGGLASPGQ